MAEFAKYIRKTQLLERIRVVVPKEKATLVRNEMYDHGYRVLQSGSYTNRNMFPQCDDSRVLLIAERETSHPIPKR